MKHIKTLEEWRDIKGYEGLYQVSDLGRVKSLAGLDARGHMRQEKILNPWKNDKGYLKVELYKNGQSKSYYVQRLVLETFEPIDGMETYDCDHINGNPLNNRLFNLQWLTHSENVKKGRRLKPICCIETGAIYPSAAEASRQTGIDNSLISKCCRGKRKTAGSFHWEFAEVNNHA